MAELNETIHQPVRLRIMAALVTLEAGNEVDFTYLRDLLRSHRRQPGRPPAQTGRGRLHRRQQDLRRTQAAHLYFRHRRRDARSSRSMWRHLESILKSK